VASLDWAAIQDPAKAGPPDRPEATHFCRVCVQEVRQDQDDDECGSCGHRLTEGGYEPGACHMCGALRLTADPEWCVEHGPDDMACPSCVRENL